jgi:threonine efflux protein
MSGVGHIMLTLAFGHLMTVMSPGPNQALVIATAARSRIGGVYVALGAWPAGAFWACMGLMGMGEAIRSLPWLELAIRVVCGCYLLFLGARILRKAFNEGGVGSMKSDETRPARLVLMGFVSNVTNPKAIAYYASIFAATGAYSLPWRWQVVAIFGMPAIGFCWNTFVALAISSPPVKRVYADAARWIDGASGSVLVLFGLKLLAAA